MTKKFWLIAGLAVLVAAVSSFAGAGAGGSSASARSNMTVVLSDNVTLELVKVEAGTFTMGARNGDDLGDAKEHKVTLTRNFYLGSTEVTQTQWAAVMGNNPSRRKGVVLPVENVSWKNAMEFCKRLNDMGLAPKGWKFTLPTEAQWEYAARGGNRSRGYKYSGSDNLDDVAWYTSNSGSKTHPVALKTANELGLYDMSGNVWEWCLDRYETGYARDPEFLTGNSGTDCVIRGGSCGNFAKDCRSAYRYHFGSGGRDGFTGFRVALVKVK